jgi:hypothetical protein
VREREKNKQQCENECKKVEKNQNFEGNIFKFVLHWLDWNLKHEKKDNKELFWIFSNFCRNIWKERKGTNERTVLSGWKTFFRLSDEEN